MFKSNKISIQHSSQSMAVSMSFFCFNFIFRQTVYCVEVSPTKFQYTMHNKPHSPVTSSSRHWYHLPSHVSAHNTIHLNNIIILYTYNKVSYFILSYFIWQCAKTFSWQYRQTLTGSLYNIDAHHAVFITHNYKGIPVWISCDQHMTQAQISVMQVLSSLSDSKEHFLNHQMEKKKEY